MATQSSHRRIRFVLSLVSAVLILLLTVLSASGGDPRAVWFSTAFQVVNVETYPQTIVARFLAPDGTVAHTITDTLPAGGARFYDPVPPLPDTFTGTVSVDAPGQVVLQVLHLAEEIIDGNEILEGVPDDQAGAAAFFPLDACILIDIHNLHPTQTALLELRGYDVDGNQAGMTGGQVPPRGTRTISPRGALGLPILFDGSGVLLASQPVEVHVRNRCRGLAAFLAPTAGTAQQYLPHVPLTVAGLITPTVQLFNINTFSATGVVSFSTGVTVAVTLPPLGMAYVTPPAATFVINLPIVLRSAGAMAAPGATASAVDAFLRPTGSAAALVSMTQPVAVFVRSVSNRLGDRGAYAYRGFADTRATGAVVLPLLFAGYQDWYTGDNIWIRNLSFLPADVRIRYTTVPTGTLYWQDVTVEPRSVTQVTMPEVDAELAAAILLSDRTIVVLAGADSTAPGDVEDRTMRYAGTNYAFNCDLLSHANFAWSPPNPVVGVPAYFVVNQITGTVPISFTWDFGDGGTGTGYTPEHVYTAAGTYAVSLSGYNCLGFGRLAISRTVVVTDVPGMARLHSGYTGFAYGGNEATWTKVYKGMAGWSSHLALQFLDATATVEAIDFYTWTAVPVATISHTASVHAPWRVDLDTVGVLPSAFMGSAGARALGPSGPVAGVDNQVADNLAMAAGTFPGGTSLLHCPQLYYNASGWNSTIDVRNTSTSSSTIQVHYSDGVTRSVTITPYAIHQFDVSAEPHVPGSAFSAFITGTQPLQAICNATSPGGGMNYEAVPTGRNIMYLPLIADVAGGLATRVLFQNVGAVTATVDIHYEGYEPFAYAVEVGPGETFERFTASEPFIVSNYTGSAILSSTQPLVPVVYVYAPGALGDMYAAYQAMVSPASTLYFPMTPQAYTGAMTGTWTAAFFVQNTAVTTTTVWVTFYDELGNAFSPPLGALPNPLSLAPYASQGVALDNVTALAPGFYAAVLTADSPISGVAFLRGDLAVQRSDKVASRAGRLGGR